MTNFNLLFVLWDSSRYMDVYNPACVEINELVDSFNQTDIQAEISADFCLWCRIFKKLLCIFHIQKKLVS